MRSGKDSHEKGAIGGLTENPSHKILIVDDDVPVGKALVRIIQGHIKGAKILNLQSVEEAIRIIGEGFDPDVIVSDMIMPGMTGMDFHAWLVQNRPDLEGRICFVSGGSHIPSVQEFMERNKVRLVNKPFEFEEIRKLVQAVLQKKS